MNSKTTLSLIEQMIMILVFFVATAICLKIFVYSNTLSSDNYTRDIAVEQAKNAAEILKYTHGDINKAMDSLSAEENGLSLDIVTEDTGSDYLGKAEIIVSDSSNVVYTLSVCWQEDAS